MELNWVCRNQLLISQVSCTQIQQWQRE